MRHDFVDSLGIFDFGSSSSASERGEPVGIHDGVSAVFEEVAFIDALFSEFFLVEFIEVFIGKLKRLRVEEVDVGGGYFL